MKSAGDADLSLDSPGLAQHVLRDVARGKDVVLLVSPPCGKAVLDHVASALQGRRDRVVRVSAQSETVEGGAGQAGLGLPALLRQLARYAEHQASGAHHAPERDIAVLTTLGPSCDRIILLMDQADALERSALRAVELACQTGGLCLVFAGLPRMLTMLEDEAIPVLRSRLIRGVRYTAIEEWQPPLAAGPAVLEPLPPRPWRMPVRAIAIPGIAVLALLGIVTVQVLGPGKTASPALPDVAPAPSAGPAETVAVSAEPKPAVDAGSAPAAPAPVPTLVPQPVLVPQPILVPQPVPAASADPAPIPIPIPDVHPARRQPDHSGHAVRTAGHPSAPREGAVKPSPDDYIGSFSPGADGVRSFKFRP